MLAGCSSPPALSGGPSALPSALSQLSGTAGSSGPPDASLAGIHACRLVPAAVVTQVLGQLASPAFESPGGLACFYYPAVPGGVGPSVIMTVTNRSAFEAEREFDQGVSQSGQIRLLPVHGIGDDAYATMLPQGEHQFELSAAKGGRAIHISVGSTNPADQQRVRDLMTTAIGNL